MCKFRPGSRNFLGFSGKTKENARKTRKILEFHNLNVFLLFCINVLNRLPRRMYKNTDNINNNDIKCNGKNDDNNHRNDTNNDSINNRNNNPDDNYNK